MAGLRGFLKLKGRKLSLRASIGLAFALAVIPILIFISSYTYRDNSLHLFARSEVYAQRSTRDAVSAVRGLLTPVENTLRVAAQLAATEPGFFRSERSRDYLHQALVSAEQIDAIYATFDDGYHRVVTRIDADRRRRDPHIPPGARWHSSWMPPYTNGPIRVRHRALFDEWPHVIKTYDVSYVKDVRQMPQYREAERTGAPAIAEPAINPDTSYPIISMGVPILRGGRHVGVMSANITLDVVSRYLSEHRFSAHSVTMLLDGQGKILAHPDRLQSMRRQGDAVVFTNLDAFPDASIAQAAAERRERGLDHLIYRSRDNGAEYLATFSRFPDTFGQKWEVLTVTPTEDFQGNLKATHRRLQLLMTLMAALELLLIYLISGRLAEPINGLSREMQNLSALSFGTREKRNSPIREVAQLQKSVTLLHNSLKSFAAFVPIGVVRELVLSGKPLTRSVQPKELTLLFTDLENFTALCEKTPPLELSEQLTGYFEEVTTVIRSEGGTIDKFIGDAVMAFWGAPTPIANQVERACRAALRIAHRMRQADAPVRIGLHHGTALVGNIGSSDRLSYTAIGDAVNVAARLEAINKEYGTTICISAEVYAAVRDLVIARPLEFVKIRGRERSLQIYELLGIRDSTDKELMAPAKTT